MTLRGDFFVLRYSETRTINLDYFTLHEEPETEEKSETEEESHGETGEPRETEEKLTHLKEHRILRGFTQEGLAELSGVSRSTISRLEQSRSCAYPKKAQKLAEALKVEPEDLR